MADESTKQPGLNRPQIIANGDLQTSFADHIFVGTRKDDIVLLRFLASLPEGLREEARLMIPKPSLKKILDAICRQCDYYPEKAETTPKTSI